MLSIGNTLQQSQQQLKLAGLVDSPMLDAELLLCDALGKNRTYLYTWPEKILTNQQKEDFGKRLQQRLLGKPIAHIIGHREFWGLNLQVTPATLIPRPDTETLIEAVLEIHSTHTQNQYSKILDLGTGSGAIALALKSEFPSYGITAVDQSTSALEIANQNAQNLNLQVNFLASDWFSEVTGTFDFIVSNPPYIEDNDPHLHQGDVRFEPLSALISGKDGLDDIKFIIYQTWSYLEAKGWLLIEHGYNQAQPIQKLLKDAGYQNIATHKDLGGNPRVSVAQKP